MPEKWFVYNIHPKRGDVQNTPEELTEVRLKIENKLKELTHPYKWFTLLYGVDRVKFGIKMENGESMKKRIVNEFKKEYPNLILTQGEEDPNTCELIAIATQCRTKLEKIPISNWTAEQIALLLHFMLNPYGYDNEAWTYLRALFGIENKITDQDARDAIAHVRRFLQDKNRIKLNK
jgi:hypothetical protein